MQLLAEVLCPLPVQMPRCANRFETLETLSKAKNPTDCMGAFLLERMDGWCGLRSTYIFSIKRGLSRKIAQTSRLSALYLLARWRVQAIGAGVTGVKTAIDIDHLTIDIARSIRT